MAKILVVDDELGIRDLMHEILSDEGHTVLLAENAAQARDLKISGTPDIVLLDVWMPDTDGVSLLKEWVGSGQMDAPVIMMSGHATIETAVQATKLGAAGFLEKPITLQKLLGAVIDGLKIPGQRSWGGGRPSGLGAGSSAGFNEATHFATASKDQQPGLISPRFNSGTQNTQGQPPMTAYASGYGAMRQSPAYYEHSSGMGGAERGQAQINTPNLNTINMDAPLREAREDFERMYFEYRLIKDNGSMTKMAEKTGLERTHLYRKLKQLGLDVTKAKRGTM